MPGKVTYRESLVQAIRQWLPGRFFSGLGDGGCRKWLPQRLVWVAVLMVWESGVSLRERFETVEKLLRRLFRGWSLGTTYQGWMDALRATTPWLYPPVARRLRRQMRAVAGRHWLREGWCAFAVDGTRVECPRTRANEAALGCAGKKRTAPQLFATTLWHLGLGLPWSFRVGPGTASERRHLEDMLPELPPKALLVADAGFTGYDLCRRLADAGQKFLLRVGGNVHLLKELGVAWRQTGDTVYLWPQNRMDEPPLVLRLLVLAQAGRKMHLLTNVVDERELTAHSAAVLYEMRWGVEVFYRSFKQTLERRTMRSHSPGAAEVELLWTLVGLWLLGLMSVSAILARGADPLSWSVALARKRVRQTLRLAFTSECGRQSQTQQLATAVKDGYARRGSKQARDWPRQKREKPPAAPKITVATAPQTRRALRLGKQNIAA